MRGEWRYALQLHKAAAKERVADQRRKSTLLTSRHAEQLQQRTRELAVQNDRLGEAVTDLMHQTEQARQQSLRDFLTGLPNRRHLVSFGETLVSEAHGGGDPLAVVVVDVDRFKQVNDTFLHATGDTVLRSLADIMTSCIRGTDVVCRTGGDEFVVLLANAGLVGAQLFVDRLQQRVAVYPWFEIADGLDISVTCGIASAVDGATLDDLITKADQAMYENKPARPSNEADATDDATGETDQPSHT